MIEIIPAIMPECLQDIQRQSREVKSLVSWVQVDVMDGNFTPSISWPYNTENTEEFIKCVDVGEKLPFLDELNYEIDLMVLSPEEEIPKWIKLGAKRFLIHIESVENSDALENIFMQARGNIEIGIAIGIETDTAILESILQEVSVIQCMGIEKIGYQGEPFSEKVIDKIERLRLMNRNIIISVDGGVSVQTAPKLVMAGAKRLVSGSAIYNSKDVAKAILQLQALGN